jgi:two-component system alkaline phosphatase synthesis response regulator PhoP
MVPVSMPRVVACDDHPHVNCTIDMALRKAGFDVETFPSGELALKAIYRVTPSLIITDCQMPGGMDGLELCRQIRLDSRFDLVPIVMLTSKGYELSEKMLQRDLKIAALVNKPFSPRELGKLAQMLVGADIAIAS